MNAIRDAVRDAVVDVHVDELSRPTMLLVPCEQWLVVAQVAYAAGAVRFEWLTAADLPTGLRVAALIRSDKDEVIIATDIAGAVLPTLSGIWPAALWQERECAEMFGIDVAGHPDLRPLLLSNAPVSAPLRRSFPLAERVHRPWPGATTAAGASPESARGSAQGRRAVGPPPGVRLDWVGDGVV